MIQYPNIFKCIIKGKISFTISINIYFATDLQTDLNLFLLMENQQWAESAYKY